MVYKVIGLFIGILVSIISVGQTHFGLKAGANLSNQYKKVSPSGYPADRSETKPLAGIQIGAFMKHALNDRLRFAMELNYASTGSKTEYLRTDFIVDANGNISGATTGYFKDRIQTIEIPAFIQYNIEKLHFGLGPAISIKISAREEGVDNKFYKNPYYKSLDVGANAMIGYSFYKTIGLNIKYVYGITDVDRRTYYRVNNRGLAFSVLYSLK